MSGNKSLLGYEAMADELTKSTLSKQQFRAYKNTEQNVKMHAQDQQRLGKKTPLKGGREYQGLDIGNMPEGRKQVIPKESSLSVALPPRLRGTPTAPTKLGVPLSSESWGNNTLQSLGIKAESPLTTTDRKNMFTGEIPTGATHKLAAEVCSLQKERSPSTLFGDKYALFQDPKGSCLLGPGDSSQQRPYPAEGDESSPYDTTCDRWSKSNVRHPVQPLVPSFSSLGLPEVSEQILRDAGFAGVWPRSGPMQRQQAGVHPADSSSSQITPFQQESAADRRKPTDVYAPTPAHIQWQPLEGGVRRPDICRGPNPEMQANGQAGDHLLQTYDMQLMRLEQQNKKRLLKARQEQDAVGRGRDGRAGISDASLPQKHHQHTDLQQQPNSVQQSTQQQLQQTHNQQQPEPVLVGTKEQWQWLRGRTQQHFQDLLTSAAQKHGRNPAAVPPSVRLDCLQRAKTMAEEQIPPNYIMKCGSYPGDPKQVNQGLPDYGAQYEPQSKPSPKAGPNTFESSKITESKRTREQRYQTQQHHQGVTGRAEPTVNAYRHMAANAFHQDRDRREKKNFKLFSSLEPGFKVAQDRLLKSTEGQARYLRYPGFCDAVNRLRDQQRRTFDEALAKEGDQRRGEEQGAAVVKGEEMDQGEKKFEEASTRGFVEGRLPDRTLAQHAPTLAPVPMRWNATSISPLPGKVSPREPSHTATRHISTEGMSLKTSDDTSIEPKKPSYKSWVAEEAEKLRKQAQQVAADKAEELRKQYEAESKIQEPKPTYTIPEQQPRTWIYRHGAYTFRERAQFIRYRHGYIYVRHVAAGVSSMLARHLRCFDQSDIEHVEQLTGSCLDHFKPDTPRMWRFGQGADAVVVEATFLDFRDGYVSLRLRGTEGVGFLYKRIQEFGKGDMGYIGSVRRRDFEMSRAGAGGVVEGGKGRGGDGRGDGGDEGTVEGQDWDRVEVGVEAREEVEVGDEDKMVVEARDVVQDQDEMEVGDEHMMEVEVEDEAEAAKDTSAPQSDDGDMEWDRVESSGEEWTEI